MNLYRSTIILAFLVISQTVFSQSSISTEFTPKLNYARFTGDGFVPAGFRLKSYTPSYSYGAFFNQTIFKRHQLSIGFNYNKNSYKTTYKPDYNANNESGRSTCISSISYFEPQIAYSFYGIKISKLRNLYFRAGAGYIATPMNGCGGMGRLYGQNAKGDSDTTTITMMSSNNNPSHFKLMLEAGKSFNFINHFKLDLGLKLRLTRPEMLTNYTIKTHGEVYDFNVLRSSSFIGFNIRFSYQYKKLNP